MNGSAVAPPNMAGKATPHRRMGLMHMTFFWGTDALTLFSGWSGTRNDMYAVALLLSFALAFLVEFFSGGRLMQPETNRATAALLQTSLQAVRMGLAYLVMLALMSFNGGVFIDAVDGHTVGFWFFGSRAFRKLEKPQEKSNSDLPTISCE